MPKKKLTEATLKALRAPPRGQVDYFDKYLPSFGVRVSQRGAKSFFVMTRSHGQLMRITLGRFHEAAKKENGAASGFLTLKEARAKAGEVIDLATSGVDPREVERKKKEAERDAASNTFRTVAEEFLTKYARVKLRPNTIDEYERALLGPDAKSLHKRPISKITKREILAIMDAMQARGAPTAADRTLAYLRKFFNWAADREFLAHPPTDRIRPVIGLRERDRALSKDEIVCVWRAFELEMTYRRDDKRPNFISAFGPFLKLLLLTGQRPAEVAKMEWRELQDLDGDNPQWVMPKAPPPPADQRTKNGLPHIVPLSPLAVEILKSVHCTSSRFVFSATGDSPISGYSKLKKRIDRILGSIREGDGLSPMEPWQLRDLRRTVSTHMHDFLGIEPHIVESCLNHVSGDSKKDVAGTYNKAMYLDRRRAAHLKWEIYLGPSQSWLKKKPILVRFGHQQMILGCASPLPFNE